MPKTNFTKDEKFGFDCEYLLEFNHKSDADTEKFTLDELEEFFRFQFDEAEKEADDFIRDHVRGKEFQWILLQEEDRISHHKKIHTDLKNHMISHGKEKIRIDDKLNQYRKENKLTIGRPLNGLLKYEDTPEAEAYNKKVIQIHNTGTAEEKMRFYYEEFKNAIKEADFKYPEDYIQIFNLTDEELVEKYKDPKFERLIFVAFEGDRGFKELDQFLREDEREEFIQLQETKFHIQLMKEYVFGKMNLFLNPLYTKVDENKILNEDVNTRVELMSQLHGTGAFRQHINNCVSFGSALGSSHRGEFIIKYVRDKESSITNVYGDQGIIGFEKENKQLFDLLLSNGKEFFITTKENEVKSVVLKDGKIQEEPAQSHMDRLGEYLKKADNYRFTGSRQFTEMNHLYHSIQKKFKETGMLKDAEKTRDLEKSVKALNEAAVAYLNYKGIDVRNLKKDPSTFKINVNGRGKHEKEQARLDVALKIFEFSNGFGGSLSFLKEKTYQAEINVYGKAIGLSENDTSALTKMILGQRGEEAARRHLKEALKEASEGNYERLGNIIVVGLKENVTQMQSIKTMDEAYYQKAALGRDVLRMVEKSQNLQIVVGGELQRETIRATKAAFNLSEAWKEGQSLMKGHFLSTERDMAKVIQSHSIAVKISQGLIELGKNEYANSTAREQINSMIQESSQMKNLMKNGKMEREDMVKDPKEMMKLFTEALTEKITSPQKEESEKTKIVKTEEKEKSDNKKEKTSSI